jgi:hypothetical protein
VTVKSIHILGCIVVSPIKFYGTIQRYVPEYGVINTIFSLEYSMERESLGKTFLMYTTFYSDCIDNSESIAMDIQSKHVAFLD